jgi:DNA-binding transcriptional ArsR family regulator
MLSALEPVMAATKIPAPSPAMEKDPPLQDRALLAPQEAEALAELFKVVANGTRLRLLHALVRESEVRVGDLAEAVGMTPQAVSNQLQRLADKGIVGARRDGNSVYYRLVRTCAPTLLEHALCFLEGGTHGAQAEPPQRP